MKNSILRNLSYLFVALALFARPAAAHVCDASFTYAPDSLDPLKIHFSSSTLNDSNTQYFWSFGDRSSSTQKNPDHTYMGSGLFNVCLIVYNNSTQCIDTVCQYIFAGDSSKTCNAEFDYNRSAVDTGIFMFFPIYSSDSSTSYFWSFGDGNSSTDRLPSHVYSQPGVYNVCLVVYDPVVNCADSVCHKLEIEEPEPEKPCNADYNYWQDFFAERTLNFEALHPSADTTTDYYWYFGDGQSENGTTAQHQFGAPGKYHVCLIVYNPGCFDSICKDVEVLDTSFNVPCTGDFSYWQDPYTDSATVVYFDAFYRGDSTAAYNWSFGDGTFSHDRSPVHIFPGPGLYRVSLLVYNLGLQCFDSIGRDIEVFEPIQHDCNAAFSYWQDPSSGHMFFYSLYINDSSTQMKWSFGDGETTDVRYPQHIYRTPGIYTACLFIYNQAKNCYDSVCQEIYVDTLQPTCSADFVYWQNMLDRTVYFLPSTISYDSATHYYWIFGDGEQSQDHAPEHTYDASGLYHVCLIVYNAERQCFDSVCNDIYVNDSSIFSACSAEFYYWQSSKNDLTVSFYPSMVTDTMTQYYWSFGDGSSSNEVYPAHLYSAPGLYRVCLIAYNNMRNCFDSLCQDIPVVYDSTVKDCDARFNYVNGSGNTVYFGPNVTTDPFAEYYWSFGDGTYSTDASTEHSYAAPGIYNVCLIVFGRSTNCIDSVCQDISAGEDTTIAECNSRFSYISDINNARTIHFTPEYTDTLTQYYWSFGDGEFSNDPNPEHTYASQGIYNVCLLVYNSLTRCFDSTCQELYIIDAHGNDCEASFTYTFMEDSSGLATIALFNNTSTGTGINSFWLFGDSKFSLAHSPSHAYPSTGEYKVCLVIVSLIDSCIDSTCQIINTDPGSRTGIGETGSDRLLRVYPVPFSSELNADLNIIRSGLLKIRVYDVLGHLHYSEDTTAKAGANHLRLNLDKLDHGIYFLEVQSGEQQMSSRIIK